MPDDSQNYGELPHLRARLAEYRTAGHHPEAAELTAEIARLTAAAKRDAASVARKRAETKERFQGLVRSIRELQGSAAEVPGGPQARDARIRELAVRARAEKEHHEELAARIREFKWILTGEEQTGSRDERAAEEGGLTGARTDERDDSAVGTDPGSGRRRRRWLVPVIVGAVVVVLAAGLFVASKVVDTRVERTLEDEVEQFLLEQDLDEILTYDDLSVSSLLGSVTLTDVAITDPITGDGVRADRLTVRVPHLEALRARGAIADDDARDLRFSSIVLDAKGLIATTTEGDAVRVESVRLALEGDLRQSLLDESLEDQILRIDRAEITIAEAELLQSEVVRDVLREIGWRGEADDLTRLDEFHLDFRHDRSRREVTLSEYRLATPLFSQSGDARVVYAGNLEDYTAWIREVGFDLQSTIHESPGAIALPGDGFDESILIDLPSVEMTLNGATAFPDDRMELDLERSSADLSLVIGEAAVALPPSALEELGWYLADIDEIVSAGAVRLDRFALDAGLLEGGRIELRELALRAPFAEFILSGEARIDDIDAMLPGSITLNGSVQRLPQSLREPLGGFAIMLGAIMPASGPFDFAIELDESGEPVLIIE